MVDKLIREITLIQTSQSWKLSTYSRIFGVSACLPMLRMNAYSRTHACTHAHFAVSLCLKFVLLQILVNCSEYVVDSIIRCYLTTRQMSAHVGGYRNDDICSH